MILGPGDVAGHELLLLSRKKGVTVYAYDDTAGPDAPESRLHSPAAPADVMAVHGMCQVPVGIGVETVGELAALIPLVGSGTLREEGILIRLGLSAVVPLIAAVRDEGYGPGRTESCRSAFQGAALAERRIGLDGHSLGLVGCCQPGRNPGTAGHDGRPRDYIRLHHRPFQSLETADGTAYQQVYPAYAQMPAQESLGADDVPDSHLREIQEPALRRTGGAVGRAEHIGADHRVAVRVYEPARTHHLRPPFLRVRIGCQRMTDPDDLAGPAARH